MLAIENYCNGTIDAIDHQCAIYPNQSLGDKPVLNCHDGYKLSQDDVGVHCEAVAPDSGTWNVSNRATCVGM